MSITADLWPPGIQGAPVCGWAEVWRGATQIFKGPAWKIWPDSLFLASYTINTWIKSRYAIKAIWFFIYREQCLDLCIFCKKKTTTAKYTIIYVKDVCGKCMCLFEQFLYMNKNKHLARIFLPVRYCCRLISKEACCGQSSSLVMFIMLMGTLIHTSSYQPTEKIINKVSRDVFTGHCSSLVSSGGEGWEKECSAWPLWWPLCVVFFSKYHCALSHLSIFNAFIFFVWRQKTNQGLNIDRFSWHLVVCAFWWT